MSEVVIFHGSTPRRIKEFNDAVSRIKIPVEGEHRKGYSPVFPYEGSIWIYKMRKEAVPAFLEFVKSNTLEISEGGTFRPAQVVINTGMKLISYFAYVMDKWRYIKRRIKRKHIGPTKNTIEIPDMTKVKPREPTVHGWGYSKVMAILPDFINEEGVEEL